MSWGKVCDTLHAHRKVAKAGALAMGYWVAAMSWCKDKRTNGFVPSDRPAQLFDEPAEAEEAVAALVRARLWEVVEGGWRFHDWNDVQRSPEEDAEHAEHVRAARVEAGRKGGLAKAANAKQAGAEPGNAQQNVATASKTKQSLALSESEASPNPKPDPSGGSAAPPGPPPPRAQQNLQGVQEQPRTAGGAGAARQRRSSPRLPRPESPRDTGWRTWREEYQRRYGSSYSSNKTTDGKAMDGAVASALEQLQTDGRSEADLEPLLRWRWRAYLADAGSRDFSLRDNKHGLQWFARGIPQYGTPWDRAAAQRAPPQPAAPPPRQPRVLVPDAGMAGISDMFK